MLKRVVYQWLLELVVEMTVRCDHGRPLSQVEGERVVLVLRRLFEDRWFREATTADGMSDVAYTLDFSKVARVDDGGRRERCCKDFYEFRGHPLYSTARS